jgi:hypothetical protein
MSDMNGRPVATGADVHIPQKPLQDVTHHAPAGVTASRTAFQSLWDACPAAAEADWPPWRT